MSNAITGQVVLGFIRRVAERTRGSESVSCVPLWFLCPLLPQFPLMMDCICKSDKLLLPLVPVGLWFITAMEAEAGHPVRKGRMRDPLLLTFSFDCVLLC